jgi:hypothetical protein
VFPAGASLTEAQQVGREGEITSMAERLCVGLRSLAFPTQPKPRCFWNASFNLVPGLAGE